MSISGTSVFLCCLLAATAAAQNFSGNYESVDGNEAYKLVLSQDGQGKLTGSLTNPSKQTFTLNGTVEDGDASGSCVCGNLSYYFEAGFEQGKLQFMLVPVDENLPDFENAVSLVFDRKNPVPRPQGDEPGSEVPRRVPEPPMTAAMENRVGKPEWGFSFPLPKGWKQRATAEGAILGHDTIAGMVLLFPHSRRTVEEVEAQMREGLQEDEGQLTLVGPIKALGKDRFTGEYTGFYQGEEVKAHAVGTLSPYGGGAFLIAVATPAVFSARLAGTVDAIANTMTYTKAPAGSVPEYFVGTWVNTTRNTETRMTFRPDGTFTDYGESSYSGEAGTDEAWGAAGANSGSGRWSARGTREQGIITIVYGNGQRRDVQYQVHVEDGQTYWNEYYFSGDLYGKQ